MANVCQPAVVMATTHNSQDERDPCNHSKECTTILFSFSVLVFFTIVSLDDYGALGGSPCFSSV